MKFEPKIKPFTIFLIHVMKDGIIEITLCPFGIYVKDINDKDTIVHELIHWKQQIEMLIIFFYLLYLIEWFIKMFFCEDAYRSISFEREAYSNSENPNYLKNRKCFSWIKYIFKN